MGGVMNDYGAFATHTHMQWKVSKSCSSLPGCRASLR
jgi:hypothetical protein